MIFEKPTCLPASSWIAVMTTVAQKVEPSLRTRKPSSSKRPTFAATASSCWGQRLSTALFR